MPRGHNGQEDKPGLGPNEPKSQATHVLMLVMPVALLNHPAEQLTKVVALETGQYAPNGHVEHTDRPD